MPNGLCDIPYRLGNFPMPYALFVPLGTTKKSLRYVRKLDDHQNTHVDVQILICPS